LIKPTCLKTKYFSAVWNAFSARRRNKKYPQSEKFPIAGGLFLKITVISEKRMVNCV